MAYLTAPATAATAAQPARNQPRKTWLRPPLCNHRATMSPDATCATITQPRCNKAQPSRNQPIFRPRNRATIPLRGGEMVAPPRAHPRAPGQTTSRLRLRRFRPDHNGVALKHGCAIAPLASKRSDHRQDDQHDGLQEDGNDLLISMSELIFNGEHRPIALESVAKLAAGVIQRVFVLAGYRSPLNSRTNPRPSYGLCGGSTFPCASQPFIASDQTPHNPLGTAKRADVATCLMITRGFMRVACHILRASLVVTAHTPARCLPARCSAQPMTRRNAGVIPSIDPEKDPAVGGVAAETKPGRKSRPLPPT
jgi:hypothetical protein